MQNHIMMQNIDHADQIMRLKQYDIGCKVNFIKKAIQFHGSELSLANAQLSSINHKS